VVGRVAGRLLGDALRGICQSEARVDPLRSPVLSRALRDSES
jgi:hypothetical protein